MSPQVVSGTEKLFVAPGVQIRLTRNLDKERGHVNGATGTIETVLDPDKKTTFTMVLNGTKNRILVHPITDGGDYFLPCTYGYATTIRRAQGSSLLLGALYFDHCYPPERGYGYVGASRFKLAQHLYHFGAIRRTDWLPVSMKQDDPDEQTRRSAQSESDEEEPKPWELDSEASGTDCDSENYSCPTDVDDEDRPGGFKPFKPSADPNEWNAFEWMEVQLGSSELPVREEEWDENGQLLVYGGTATPE